MSLDTPIAKKTTPIAYGYLKNIKGVGPKTLAALNQLGIKTVEQLLFHLPIRYEDHTKVTPINQLQANQRLIVRGLIKQVSTHSSTKQQISCVISDGSASLTVVFFNAPYLKHLLSVGKKILCFGQIQWFKGQLRMIHPQVLSTPARDDQLTPTYRVSGGLNQKKMRNLVTESFEQLNENSNLFAELPDAWLKEQELPTLYQALKTLHNPPIQSKNTAHIIANAQRRLSMDSLMAQCIFIRKARQQSEQTLGQPLTVDDEALEQFKSCLPFTLTEGQATCLKNIRLNLAQKQPMLRLLQGDVGSGKTVLAAATAFIASYNGFQAAIMAPTELLANQLYSQIKNWLEPLGLRTALLTGRLSEKEKAQLRITISRGGTDIVVGTHALIQTTVQFKNLAACIIDEQHRFGVEQRLALHDKGHVPHILLMSATPIPRSLAMALFGELSIDELRVRPKGRLPITTTVMPDARRTILIEQIHQQCLNGEQVFWVCPRIEDSDEAEPENQPTEEQAQYNDDAPQVGVSATSLSENLSLHLPGLSIGLIHGKMNDEEKATVMQAFRESRHHILVATTVIEVGIDVPRANIIVIESAQRFGLSQLHQLRGRVGRGSKPGYCILMYPHPLSKQGRARLAILKDHHDGFDIAEKDLLLRGPGQWLGTAQSGAPDQLISQTHTLTEMMALAAKWAQRLLDDNGDLAEKIIVRWKNKQLRYARG